MSDLVRWQLTDGTVPETWTMELNPDDMTLPDITKTLDYKSSSGPGGNAIVFEGRDAVSQGNWKGSILSLAQYDNVTKWVNKRRQISLTDDIGRTWVIYPTKFTAERKRNTSNQWYHTYEVDFIVLDWP